MSGPEERLRQVLAAEVAEVEAAPGALHDIRRRIAARRRRRPWRLVALGVPAFATAAAVVIGLATCGPPRPDAAPEPADSPAVTSSVPPAPTPTSPFDPLTSLGPLPPPGTPRTALSPVYYLGTSPRGPVLYREFHPTVVVGTDPAAAAWAAVEVMLTPGSAADPDYITRWPAGAKVRGAEVSGDTVTINLDGLGDTAPGDAAVTARSIDQLVYTATAASRTSRLRLLVGGRVVSRLWGVDVAAPLPRRAPVEALAPLWLIEPAHDVAVSRPLAVHVSGIVFEATALLRVRDAGGAVVAQRTLTLSKGPPEVGEARAEIPLAPGRYTVEVYALSAADGSEQFRDDHDVTVR